MAYTDEEKEIKLNAIFKDMEGGSSLRSALIESKLSLKAFYSWIDNDEDKREQYARACEARADKIADEIIDIADSSEADCYMDDEGVTKIDGNTVQRARLQVDTRKWLLGKLQPKKYGDKIDVTTGGDKIQSVATAINIGIVKPIEED